MKVTEASTSTGRIISASAILYSDKFEELDRFELFCRNVPGYIPDPYSLWVNKGLKKLKRIKHESLSNDVRNA